MNYRSRALLDLAYELDCTVRVSGICTGGTGEPAHANWAIWGKGGAMKAHDFAFASCCRACHIALDQGRELTDAGREYHWLRGHVETMRQLWERGLLRVATEAKPLSDERSTLEVSRTTQKKRREGLPEKEGAGLAAPHSLPPSRRRGSKRGTHTAKPDKCRIGWTK